MKSQISGLVRGKAESALSKRSGSSAEKKKTVEVVVCGDPWMNTAVPTNRSKHAERVLAKKRDSKLQRKKGGPVIFQMKQSFKDVQRLGATKFENWQKKQFEESIIEDLGGRKSKAQKMPLKMLIGIRAKRDRIAKLQEEEAKDGDLVRAKRSRVHHSSDRDKETQTRDRQAPLGEAKVRGGVMRVPRHLLEGAGMSPRAKQGKR